ncbi:MAG: DUF4236 domain-containing protein [Treponema sp.]|nr:DUF4236 domain-containing protein [Treponema sp.]
MGFRFRKSMKIGPVRLNVSKSGLGVSTGVKGARIGVNSKGKVYGSVGVKGMTYRKQFGGADNKTSSGDDTETVTEVPQADVVVCSFGVALIVLSLIITVFSKTLGIVGIVVGAMLLIASVVFAVRKNNVEMLRAKIVQDAQLSEDEVVRLLVEYCHWKKLAGEEARQMIEAITQERADFLEQNESEQ